MGLVQTMAWYSILSTAAIFREKIEAEILVLIIKIPRKCLYNKPEIYWTTPDFKSFFF